MEALGPCWSLLEGCSVLLAAGMEKVSPGIVMLLSKTRELLPAALPADPKGSLGSVPTHPAFSTAVGSPPWTLLWEGRVIPDGEQPLSPALSRTDIGVGKTAWKIPGV